MKDHLSTTGRRRRTILIVDTSIKYRDLSLGGFKLLAHKTSKEVVSGLTPQLDDLGRALDKRIQGVCEGVH